MECTIKLLTEADATIYRSLRLRSFQEAPLAFSESYEDEKDRLLPDFVEELKVLGDPPDWFVLGAFSTENKLVGFLKFRRDRRTKARHKSMLHAMYVDPSFRGQGVGRKIVLDLLDRIRGLKDLEQIHLWVLHAGSSASGFYKSFGFESQGPFVKKDLKINGQYVDAEYMVLYL